MPNTRPRSPARAFVFALLAPLLAFATCAPPEGSGDPASERVSSNLTPGAAVLLVVGNATLSAGDAALKQRLEQGFQAAVIVKTGPAVGPADGAGKALVVISESVN